MRCRVLVVDDCRSNRTYVENLLSLSSEIQFTCVCNGAEALKVLEERQDFDLILMDWEMPVMDGPTTFSEIKKRGIQIPIIMMSGKGDTKDVMQMLNSGAAEYMMKPFTMDILFDKIERASGKVVMYAL